MQPFFLAKSYHALAAIIRRLPLKWQVKLASSGRNYFMQQFINASAKTSYVPADELGLTLWGIQFRTPLANSAGMFKNGEGYDVVAKLGAGAYLAGTSTANARAGNNKHGIHLPFISLPESQAAINFLGLPNYGDERLSARVITQNKIAGCPIGWSIMRSPDFGEEEGLNQMLVSLRRYQLNPQIDFIEINESCPNIKSSSANISSRLERISREFLQQRQRHLPVIVKLSNDLTPLVLNEIIECLLRCGFDGINLGNTSVAYNELLPLIALGEQEMFNYFTSNFGGGVSGRLLKERSLALCGIAAQQLAKLKPNHEFHIIRSGGIDCLSDLAASKAHGVSYNQWYSGFFDAYALAEDEVYRQFFI